MLLSAAEIKDNTLTAEMQRRKLSSSISLCLLLSPFISFLYLVASLKIFQNLIENLSKLRFKSSKVELRSSPVTTRDSPSKLNFVDFAYARHSSNKFGSALAQSQRWLSARCFLGSAIRKQASDGSRCSKS